MALNIFFFFLSVIFSFIPFYMSCIFVLLAKCMQGLLDMGVFLRVPSLKKGILLLAPTKQICKFQLFLMKIYRLFINSGGQ